MSTNGEPPDELRVRLRWPGTVPSADDADPAAPGRADEAPIAPDPVFDLPTAPVPLIADEPPLRFPAEARQEPEAPPDEPGTPIGWDEPAGYERPVQEPASPEPMSQEPIRYRATGQAAVDHQAERHEAVRHEPFTYAAVGDTGPEDEAEDVDDIHDAEEIEDDEPDDRRGPPPRQEGGQVGSRPAITAQELILAGRSDSIQAALASIALRVDALTSTTSTFRNLVSDRITDYAEQVSRQGASAASDIDEYRHLHERSLEQIRRSVGDAEGDIRRLARVVGDLEAKSGALVAAVRESSDAVDHMMTERDQVSDALLRNLDRLGQQVSVVVEQGLTDTAASLARLEDAVAELTGGAGGDSLTRLDDAVSALSNERDRQAALSAELEEQVIALADDREHGVASLTRLERVIMELTSNRDRTVTRALSRIESRLDEVSANVAVPSNDDMVGILTRLDERLKDLSTELVTGRDRETSRVLTQLSGQVDGLTSLVSQERTDLQPIEARLHRLSRAAASPVDLSEITRRLDEMTETLSQHAPPDLSDLHNHLDEVAEALGRAGPGLDPGWAAILGRLDEVVPALEIVSDRVAQSAERAAGQIAAGGAEREERQLLLSRFDELGQQLGEQLESLRRRIALRARPPNQVFDEDTIAAIAEAVAARLSGPEPRVSRSAPDRAATTAPVVPGPEEPPRPRLPRNVR